MFEIRLQTHTAGSKRESIFIEEFETQEEAEKEIDRLESISKEQIESGQFVKTSDYYYIKELSKEN